MIITVENLTFYYSSIPALKNVTIKIEGSKLVTILGPNGSGKTTFLKCLCRLLKPKVGVIYIDNKRIWDMDLKVFTQQVGYVPQMHYPVLPYRVIDVVVSGRTPYLEFLGIPSKKDYELALQALKLVGCEHLAERPYTQLSSGELRLILIARALVQQPKVLLLDEPTSNLDFRNKITVMSILRNLARKGLLVITTEHDPNIATMFSDEVILMKNGLIVAHGKPYEVINEENIKHLYNIDVEVFTLNNYKLVIPKITS